ncbi:MAG: hypothetical protein FWB78_12990 [Treponema sp.]|nr:hypothetical protein [Treponema sp.]
MTAKFTVGDLVTVNDVYLREGKAFFGKNLKHGKFQGKIAKVYENTHDERDGHGDVWQTFYGFESGLQICERFLSRVA